MPRSSPQTQTYLYYFTAFPDWNSKESWNSTKAEQLFCFHQQPSQCLCFSSPQPNETSIKFTHTHVCWQYNTLSFQTQEDGRFGSKFSVWCVHWPCSLFWKVSSMDSASRLQDSESVTVLFVAQTLFRQLLTRSWEWVQNPAAFNRYGSCREVDMHVTEHWTLQYLSSIFRTISHIISYSLKWSELQLLTGNLAIKNVCHSAASRLTFFIMDLLFSVLFFVPTSTSLRCMSVIHNLRLNPGHFE